MTRADRARASFEIQYREARITFRRGSPIFTRGLAARVPAFLCVLEREVPVILEPLSLRKREADAEASSTPEASSEER